MTPSSSNSTPEMSLPSYTLFGSVTFASALSVGNRSSEDTTSDVRVAGVIFPGLAQNSSCLVCQHGALEAAQASVAVVHYTHQLANAASRMPPSHVLPLPVFQ